MGLNLLHNIFRFKEIFLSPRNIQENQLNKHKKNLDTNKEKNNTKYKRDLMRNTC